MTMRTIKEIYSGHSEMPYINPKYEEELLRKPISKANMNRTEEGLLPGHVIMLWRINFGTYTNQSKPHKYFYTTYGIDAQKELDYLIKEAYVICDTAFDSLKHLAAPQLKVFLKARGVSGLSKMKREELDLVIKEVYSEEALGQLFDVRGYSLTPKGLDTLKKYTEIVAKHPQKKF